MAEKQKISKPILDVEKVAVVNLWAKALDARRAIQDIEGNEESTKVALWSLQEFEEMVWDLFDHIPHRKSIFLRIEEGE